MSRTVLAQPDSGAAPGIWDGVFPSLGPFANVLSSEVGVFLGLVWFGAFLFTAYHVVAAIAGLAKARRERRPESVDEHTSGLLWSGGATAGLAAVPVIYGILASGV